MFETPRSTPRESLHPQQTGPVSVEASDTTLVNHPPSRKLKLERVRSSP